MLFYSLYDLLEFNIYFSSTLNVTIPLMFSFGKSFSGKMYMI